MISFSNFINRTRTFFARAIAVALVMLLVQAPQLAAQVSGVSASQAGRPMALHIVILDGDNALNNIRQRTAREPIVQVEDENHKPVAGAAVLFTIRRGSKGASGSFSGAMTLTAVTGIDGRAVATGFQPNLVQGAFTITVQASVGAVTTAAVITQTNVIGALTAAQVASTAAVHHGLFAGHFWVIAATAAAATGVTVATVVLTRSNGATITPGTGTVKP